MSVFDARKQIHDEAEERAMEVIRPYTTRRHLPDRLISFYDRICAWDMKVSIFVEQNSHDEYFRLLDEGIPVFIVYQQRNEVALKADWIQNLRWDGPKSPSKKSTSGDPYYIIDGGIPLRKFLEEVRAHFCGELLIPDRNHVGLYYCSRCKQYIDIVEAK